MQLMTKSFLLNTDCINRYSNNATEYFLIEEAVITNM